MADSKESETEQNTSNDNDKVPAHDSEMNDDDSSKNVEESLAENTTQAEVNDSLTVECPPTSAVNTNEFKKPKSTCKHKHRSRVVKKKLKPMKKRKWRPLWKLTRKERDKVHEREMKRIQRDREVLLAAGVALAPHNTSDFLIKDRNMSSPEDFDVDRAVFCREDSFDKDFEEEYESFYSNYLEKLTKFELIERWIEVEDLIEIAEKQLNAMRERKRLLGLSGNVNDSEMTKIEVFKEEINKLIVENDELRQKNARFEKYLTDISP